jgi:multidrug resistance protein MdtO
MAFLFPHMDSITSLTILVATITLLAAWIAGGRVFNYVGLQIAFSFYLVALEGFSAPTQLAPARDRLVGILLALFVMWFIFDRIWPVRTVTAMRRALVSVLRNDASLFRLEAENTHRQERMHQADVLRDRIGKTVASLRTMNDEVAYEFGVDRELHARSSEAMLHAAFIAVALFWNELAMLHADQYRNFLREPRLAGLRHKIADRMDVMAESVGQKTAYQVTDTTTLMDSVLLKTPRYGEYASNAASRFEELQKSIAGLSIQV